LQAEATRRTQAEKALVERSEQLRALAGELTLAEQRERRRLAKVVHDHLQQLLVAARYHVPQLSASNDPAVRQAADKIDRLLGDCVNISRTLTVELSPPILHEEGFLEGLHWLAGSMKEHHGLAGTINDGVQIPTLADELK